MQIKLPDLPYAASALEPHVSAETLETHHGKHHRGYVEKTCKLLEGTSLEGKSLEEIILAADGEGKKPLFNNAAQVWNHTFFWQCMTPQGGGQPKGPIADKIAEDCGSYEDFRKKFSDAAAGQFGSGWAWLVLDKGKLDIISTGNADNPLTKGQAPILTLDVWEHAYYLDYKNRRPDFIAAFLDNLLNWDFANENLAKATA